MLTQDDQSRWPRQSLARYRRKEEIGSVRQLSYASHFSITVMKHYDHGSGSSQKEGLIRTIESRGLDPRRQSGGSGQRAEGRGQRAEGRGQRAAGRENELEMLRVSKISGPTSSDTLPPVRSHS